MSMPLNRSFFCIVLFTLCVGFVATMSIAKEIPDPTAQLRPFVEKVVNVLTDENLQGEDKCFERREKVMEIVLERFDFFEMSKRVLGGDHYQ